MLDSWTEESASALIHLNDSCLADAGPRGVCDLKLALIDTQFCSQGVLSQFEQSCFKDYQLKDFFIYKKSLRGDLDQSDQPNLDLLMENMASVLVLKD